MAVWRSVNLSQISVRAAYSPGMLFPVLQMTDVGAQQLDLPVLLLLELLQLDGVFLLLALQPAIEPMAEQFLA